MRAVCFLHLCDLRPCDLKMESASYYQEFFPCNSSSLVGENKEPLIQHQYFGLTGLWLTAVSLLRTMRTLSWILLGCNMAAAAGCVVYGHMMFRRLSLLFLLRQGGSSPSGTTQCSSLLIVLLLGGAGRGWGIKKWMEWSFECAWWSLHPVLGSQRWGLSGPKAGPFKVHRIMWCGPVRASVGRTHFSISL